MAQDFLYLRSNNLVLLNLQQISQADSEWPFDQQYPFSCGNSLFHRLL